jgi:predicted S18 family serine protease
MAISFMKLVESVQRAQTSVRQIENSLNQLKTYQRQGPYHDAYSVKYLQIFKLYTAKYKGQTRIFQIVTAILHWARHVVSI